MIVQIDTREKKAELARIQRGLERAGVRTINSKLYVGDYMSLDNAFLVIDRKKDLQELCGNITQQHERFQAELMRAREIGIRIIILCEHGGNIKSLEDVYFWQNPRLLKSPKAVTGKTLYKALCTIRDRYGVRFEFCDKRQTADKIVELLNNGKRLDQVTQTNN